MTGGAAYDRSTFADALRMVGLAPGMVVMSHANVGFFGMPAEGRTPQAVFDTILGAFLDVLGPDGTLVVPTFTYSFARGQIFDPEATPSTCGMFSEMLRRHPQAVRSTDPQYSIAAIGRLAVELTRNPPEDSFGEDCFFARLLQHRGIICNLNFDAGATFLHFIEKLLRVPYRYNKEFPGTIRHNGHEQRLRSVIYVQDLNQPQTIAAFEAFDALAKQAGKVRSTTLGRGTILAMATEDAHQLMAETLPTRPYLMIMAEKTGIPPNLEPLVGSEPLIPPQVSVSISAPDLSAALRPLNRQGVGPGIEAALTCLSTIVPLNTHHIPTGSIVGGHLVPERWQVISAELHREDGSLAASLATHPKLVPAHSRSFTGTISRENLLAHLSEHCVVGENRWALSLSPDELDSPSYHVAITVLNSFGALAYAVSGIAPVMLACDLGGDDADAVTQVVAAWRDAAPEEQAGIGLLIYPKPFAPEALVPPGTKVVRITELNCPEMLHQIIAAAKLLG